MQRCIRILTVSVLAAAFVFVAGCGMDEAKVESISRRVAAEEAQKAIETYARSFAPVKFGFGGALETEWSHAQGVKTGNMIFVAGQQPYDTNLDEKGMPKTDLETGRNFEQQLTTVLENIQKVLANYGATMDDVVFLQAFVDEKAGKNTAEFNNASKVIQKFFPKGLQAMTFVSVENLFGPEQLIEANAIAVVSK
jgi:enamine deaminase RidA (YjgF/YER057c/UK114 family)